jgi:hypothetical protein
VLLDACRHREGCSAMCMTDNKANQRPSVSHENATTADPHQQLFTGVGD